MEKTNLLKPVHILAPFSFLLFLISVLEFSRADSQFTYLQSFCSDFEHYDQGSDYENNLSYLITNLTTKSNTVKFHSFTTGKGDDKITGLFLCTGVDTNQVCHNCVSRAVGDIAQRCSYRKDAIIWYRECMVRYAPSSNFSLFDDFLYFINVTVPAAVYYQFNQQLSDTFSSLIRNATAGNSTSRSASTFVSVGHGITLSGYVDCTPDIGMSGCNKCFQSALSKFPVLGTQRGQLLQPSCWLTYNFSDAGTPSLCKGHNITLGVVSSVAAALLLANVIFCLLRRKIPRKPTGLDEIESMESLHFEFVAIKAATDDFSVANKLGRGGFGVVYLGTLADGKSVAVKRLSNASGQGMREFKTEACLAAKLQHKNLVKLFGFCLEGAEMLLIYEFVPNKSLDRFLFDPKRRAQLNWETRYKIIVGIAQGLQYLHQYSRHKIIHRDLKPGNILLDADMNPKIADFGMAKLFGADQTQGNTSRVAGTFGYMAPEYTRSGHFSTKSDVFSYGVILLEIISGVKNYGSESDSEDENLLNYAWRLWNERAQLTLVDSELGSDYSSKDEIERCIHVGLLCIQKDPAKRPNIASVLLMLNAGPIIPPPPTSPPSFPYSPEKPAVSPSSCVIQTGDGITVLSPR